MPRTNDLAYLRMLLTSGIELMTLMPALSEALKRLVPSFSLSMIRVDQQCAPHAHYSEFFDEFSHQLFATAGDHWTAETNDPAAFPNLMRRAVPYGNLVALPPGYLEGAIYQQFFSRNGIHHTLDVALRDSSGPLGILGIFREKQAPPFSRAEVAMVHELYPLLVHACVARPMPEHHEEIDSAMLIASKNGVIQWASPEALRWLADAIGPARDRASFYERKLLPEACRALCRSLWEHQSGTASIRELRAVPTLTLAVPGGRVRLRAYAMTPQLGSYSRDAQAGISMALEMNQKLRVMTALSRSDLPLQLRKLALLQWSGEGNEQIGVALGISRATLKSYTKQLYARLGVQSRAELVEGVEQRAKAVSFDLNRHRPRPEALN